MVAPEQPMYDPIDGRRAFLRMALGVGIGAGLGATVAVDAMTGVSKGAEELTGRPTGNAGEEELRRDNCSTVDDPEECYSYYDPTAKEMLAIAVEAPLMEEGIFRGVPSFILDKVSGDPRDGTPREVLKRGTRDLTFSKREIITGVVSSVLFGAVHNMTTKGFDTRTVPAVQTTLGLAFWGLARKFGLPSSIAMHATYNHSVLRAMKKGIVR